MPDLAQQSLFEAAADSGPRRCARKQREEGRADEIRPPDPDERLPTVAARKWLSVESVVLALAVVVGAALLAGLFMGRDVRETPLDQAGVEAMVERIIAAESGGDPNARNQRSSATGAAQFLDDTWLEAIRKHRRDLVQGRSDKELLELRRDAELAREMVGRLVEQYAIMLSRRGLPTTPGSLYLVHFAGPAGAVALLTGAESADAASLMAAADVTGRTTREKLVNANPFLKTLTVGDLKVWADRKMAAGNSLKRL